MLGIVSGVAIPVVDHDFAKIEGRNALEAGDVNAKLVGVRSALVVRVYAAIGAEMMFRGPCVEPVSREFFRSLQNLEFSGS